MPGYQLKGTVKKIMEPMRFESGFVKREFVVTTSDERYPQDIKFECVKERCSLLDEIKIGQKVLVSFDLRGNENKGRYFVNLTAWKIEPCDSDCDEDVANDFEVEDETELSDELDETLPPF